MKQLCFLVLATLITVNNIFGQNIWNLHNKETMEDTLRCLWENEIDTTSTLSECESKCLNIWFQRNRGSFDFSQKNVAFFYSSDGVIRVSKHFFFTNLVKSIHRDGRDPLTTIYVFYFEEKESSLTGYDAVIFDSCKKDLSKKDVIKRLKKYDKVRY